MRDFEGFMRKFKLFWQYPVITEKTFYEQNTDIPIEKVCYIGDDTVDIELLGKVGLSVIVPNSNPILKEYKFDWVTSRTGGNGAVRDTCDLIYFSKSLNEKT